MELPTGEVVYQTAQGAFKFQLRTPEGPEEIVLAPEEFVQKLRERGFGEAEIDSIIAKLGADPRPK